MGPLFGPGTAFSVTIPVDADPAERELGLALIAVTWNGFTDKVAFWDAPPNEAEIVAVPSVPTTRCEIGNVTVVAPIATFTEAGTPASLALEHFRVTVSPPARAGPVRVTVPVRAVADPPTT